MQPDIAACFSTLEFVAVCAVHQVFFKARNVFVNRKNIHIDLILHLFYGSAAVAVSSLLRHRINSQGAPESSDQCMVFAKQTSMPTVDGTPASSEWVTQFMQYRHLQDPAIDLGTEQFGHESCHQMPVMSTEVTWKPCVRPSKVGRCADIQHNSLEKLGGQAQQAQK